MNLNLWKFGLLNFPLDFICYYLSLPKSNWTFFAEFPEFLSPLVLNYEGIVLCGDFNIHTEDSANINATHFVNIMCSFYFKQFVCGKTKTEHCF